MLQKLILLIIAAIFLTGCGASAPEEDAKFDNSVTLTAAGETAPPEASPEYGLSSSAEIPETTVTASEAEYFLFGKYTNTITDDDGLTLLYEKQSQPSFCSADPERSAWVDEILNDIDQAYKSDSSNLYDYAVEFVELNGTDVFYSHSNYQQLGIARHDSTVVSLISLSSLYSGGTHPNSVQIAYNLDIENQRLLRLEDVIAEDAAQELAQLVLAKVNETFAPLGEGALFSDYEEWIDTSMVYGNMTPYWYLNDTGLVIFYNQYELGPYAAGIIKAELPYEALSGILLEDYFPAEPDGTPGDLVLRGDWEGYRRIPITIESEGETLLIGVEGHVHQVQLSEVLWLEDTPIDQELLFSAMSLGQNDVLELTGGYTDGARSFAIEFINGQGEHKLYYIHDGELSAEP
ncbi:MAG: DUF3298 domain-containing protein [Ruminococcaceae bacterium]|nr:DUF3298 domain-containing protein [Oscillospiraceae bacterium]